MACCYCGFPFQAVIRDTCMNGCNGRLWIVWRVVIAAFLSRRSFVTHAWTAVMAGCVAFIIVALLFRTSSVTEFWTRKLSRILTPASSFRSVIYDTYLNSSSDWLWIVCHGIYYCGFLFQDIIRYRILNEEAQRDFNSGPSAYFQIDTATGTLFLIRSVKDTNIIRFVVSVVLSCMFCHIDEGFSSKLIHCAVSCVCVFVCGLCVCERCQHPLSCC